MSTTKIKTIFYSGVALACLVLVSGVLKLVTELSWLYVLAWGLFAAGLGAVIARIIYHIAIDDNAPETWAVSIYLMLACASWLGCILCTSWDWLFVWTAALVAFLMMGGGNRFLRMVLPVQEECTVLEKLRRECRYCFVSDDPQQGPDTDRPVCPLEGEALTVDEAMERGYGALGANGLEYLKMIERKIIQLAEQEEE